MKLKIISLVSFSGDFCACIFVFSLIAFYQLPFPEWPWAILSLGIILLWIKKVSKSFRVLWKGGFREILKNKK